MTGNRVLEVAIAISIGALLVFIRRVCVWNILFKYRNIQPLFIVFCIC